MLLKAGLALAMALAVQLGDSQAQVAKTATGGNAAQAPHGPKFKEGAISVSRGEKVFVEFCAVCHGLHGKGDGPRAAHFADYQYIPDLTSEGFLTGRDPEVLDGIRNGLRRLEEPLIVMPQFKYILSESDIQSALAYVKTLSAPAKQPTVKTGKRS